MSEITVNAQLLIEAIQEQRNRAMNDAAAAMARSVQFQNENESLRKEITELKEKKGN